MKMVMTGNEAAAYGSMVAKAQVVAAYPITPQTTVVEKIAELVGQGEMKSEYIKVESEHSAMAACIAASNTGVRAFTATSAQGLALMHELLHWASAARTPVVMVNVNRGMGPPWSVWADHTDSVSQRDTGWMQFYAERNQEVLDTILQAYWVGEQEDILLPALITEDAFYLSHTSEIVDVPEPELVDKYLPDFDPPFKLDVDGPYGFGSLSMPHQWYMELRYKIADALDKCRDRIKKADKEFEKVFGRSYGGLLDTYRCENADVVLLCAGTQASTTREVVDKLRGEGKNVGLARLRVFRPFPVEDVRALGESIKTIGVMDRCYSFGFEGPFFSEVKASLYNAEDRPLIKNYILGIGGRDVTMQDIENLYNDLYQIKDEGLNKEVEWIKLKGKQETPRWGC